MTERYIGLMSGTSMDGIDAALVDFSGDPPRLVCTHSKTYPNHLYERLLATRELPDDALHELNDLDREVGEIFAAAATELIIRAGTSADSIAAIGCHGQTIRHRPHAREPFSLQLGDAQVIASRTGITTVTDFRSADIHAGGEGAPLAPGFHAAVLRSESEDRIVVNIGGIANLTMLPRNLAFDVTGFDSGPGNTLMDMWIMKHRRQHYDTAGAWARSGAVDEGLLTRLLDDGYFSLAAPKSTGFEHFNLDWLQSRLAPAPAPADVQATLCELTAATIADAVISAGLENPHLLVCGGGVHNDYLMERLRDRLPVCSVDSTAICGIDPDWVEAMAFAWLARRTLLGQPGNLPSVTGARDAVVLGKVSSTA